MTIKINIIPKKQQKFYSRTELEVGHAYINPEFPDFVYIAHGSNVLKSGTIVYAQCLDGIHVIGSLSSVNKYIEVNLEINVTEV